MSWLEVWVLAEKILVGDEIDNTLVVDASIEEIGVVVEVSTTHVYNPKEEVKVIRWVQ